MKLHLPSRKYIIGFFSLLVAIAVLLTVVPAVYADDGGPLTPIPGLGRLPNETLIRMHKQEISWYNDQESLFKKANSLASAYADLIKAHGSAGKDVTILQTGLDNFNADIKASREIHNVAGAAIFNLIGFRSIGIVGDRLVAGQSILDGRASLREAHFRLINAMEQLRKNFNQWRHTRVIQADPYSYP